MNYIKYLIIILVELSIAGCQTEETLQTFMVKHQDNPEVRSLDISRDILELKQQLETDNAKYDKLIESIDRANVLVFKVKDNNKIDYQNDIETLKTILSNKKYDKLISVGNTSKGLQAYVLGGDKEKVTEVIIKGNDDQQGWVLVRVTGENIDLNQIINLTSEINLKDLNDFGKLF